MKCPYSPSCGADLQSPAEQFLHRELHKENWAVLKLLGADGSLHTLQTLGSIARLMEAYHEAMTEAAKHGA